MKKSTAKMREKPVEDHLRDEVKIRGGFCVKLNPLWNIGIPDRLVILPGFIGLVETKRPKGGILSGLQKWWGRRLTALNPGTYCVLNTKERIDAFLSAYPVRKEHVKAQ